MTKTNKKFLMEVTAVDPDWLKELAPTLYEVGIFEESENDKFFGN
mgnify:FL=1